MNDNKTRYFIEVCNTLSIAQAAKTCNADISTIKKALKSIEDFYNIRLFEKNNGKLTLTDDGAHYLQYCVTMEDAYNKFINSIHHVNNLKLGLGSFAYASKAFSLTLLGKKNNIDLTIQEVRINSFVNSLLNKKIDLFIGSSIVTDKNLLFYRQLGTTQIYAIGTNRDYLSHSHISINQLKKKQIYLHKDKDIDIYSFLLDNGVKNIVLVDSFSKITEALCLSDNNISLTHGNVFGNSINDFLFSIPISDMTVPYGIYCRKELENTIVNFIDDIAEFFSK
ncbi:MAG: LysR family transcriptional regulator [Erysipelotrichaceae bacterium]